MDFSEWQSKYPLVFPCYPICGFDVRPGWTKLVGELCAGLQQALTESPVEGFEVEQVKEKFGGLRFYVSTATDDMHDMISAAEAESFTLCERCGEAGKPRSGGWIRTLCDGCDNGR